MDLVREERPPEEVKKIVEARKRSEHIDALAASLSKLVGLPIMVGGVCTACWIIVTESDISNTSALLLMFVILMGGLMCREATFKSIAERFIDAIPGGKH